MTERVEWVMFTLSRELESSSDEPWMRERVRWMRQWMPEDGPFRLIKRTIIDEEVPDVA